MLDEKRIQFCSKMSSIGSGYDQAVSTFSPDGRIFQVEYAMKAVENSATIIGLRCTDGVILASEKLIASELHMPGDCSRIFKIDDHIGMVCAGLLPDARSVVNTCRDEANNFRSQFGRPIPVSQLCYNVSRLLHTYTRHDAVRPFGCRGAAAGKAKNNARTEIEKLDFDTLTVEEGLKHAARIIHSVHDEGKDRSFELELTWVTRDNPKHGRVPVDVAKAAEDAAKAELADSDSEDDM